MWMIIRAAAQFPTLIFTSALVVTVGFWLLVLMHRADRYSFDADAPAMARALHGTPVAVAGSAMVASAWLVSLTGMILLAGAGMTGLGEAVARVGLLALSTLIAWSATRGLTHRLGKLFSGAPGPLPDDVASGAPFDPGSSRVHG